MATHLLSAAPLHPKPHHSGGLIRGRQLIPVQTPESWYRRDDLQLAVLARYREHNGSPTGSRFQVCARWKWLPLSEAEAPSISTVVGTSGDFIASSEFFRNGLLSFRHLLFRRPLADLLVAAGRPAWKVVEVQIH
jgi:hypothetical protein